MDPDTQTALEQALSRLKHDLGKYVAFQQRWLGPEAALEERRDALVADLTSTRRGPEGTRDAVAVWAELRPELVGERPLAGGGVVDLAGDPDVVRIDAAMAVIADIVDAVRGGTLDLEAVPRGEAAALQVADACRDLVRRVRAGEL